MTFLVEDITLKRGADFAKTFQWLAPTSLSDPTLTPVNITGYAFLFTVFDALTNALVMVKAATISNSLTGQFDVTFSAMESLIFIDGLKYNYEIEYRYQSAQSTVVGGALYVQSTELRAFDWEKTIISQYNNSTRLKNIIDLFNRNLAIKYLIDSFYLLIWNVATATSWGLDFWGKIVGAPRVLTIPTGEDSFGFVEASDALPFNDGTFYGGEVSTSNYRLSDDAYRVLIYAKALANISDGSIDSINTLLRTLFPNRGNCYVIDGLDKTMRYNFEFSLSVVEWALLTQTDVLPRPAGISATITTI